LGFIGFTLVNLQLETLADRSPVKKAK